MKPLRTYVACFAALLLLLAFAAADASARSVYVSNGRGSVAVIDTATNLVSPTQIGVGESPGAVAITPDGKTAFVANLIDTATNTAGPEIVIGKHPEAIAITPDGRTAYVVTSAGFSTIDIATGALSAEPIETGVDPSAIAITPDGRTAYVTNGGSNDVAVIDTATNTVITHIEVGTEPSAIAITPDGRTAYVVNHLSESVSVIDLATNTVRQPPIQIGTEPQAIAISPNGATAYVGTDADGIFAIDLVTNTASPLPAVTSGSGSLAVSADNRTLYATMRPNTAVLAIDTATNAMVRISTAGTAAGLAITPDQSPTAVLSGPSAPIVAGTPVTFGGSASTDPDSPIASYSFNFGDGGSQTGAAATSSHIFNSPGTYTVSLATTDSEGCSQRFVFTGQTASCSGGPSAQATQQVTVVAAKTGTTAPVHVVRAPRVKVACPPSAKPAGCTFKLQVVTRKPTKKHHKVTAESAVAKAKVKAGKSASVTLHPKPAFAKRLVAAKKLLVKETVTAKGKTKTRFLQLRVVR